MKNTQVQVLGKLLDLDVPISTRTLQNYARWGLIPKPSKKFGRGNETEYAPETAAEAYASFLAMRGAIFQDLKASPETVAEARKIALHLEHGNYRSYKDLEKDKELKKLLEGKEIEAILAVEWLKIRNNVLYGENEELYREMQRIIQERDTAVREGRSEDAEAANEKLIALADEKKRREFLNKLTAGALFASSYAETEWADDVSGK